MLGAGFKIAMRDLEIRGAGNLLGAEQSGHIAVVGYEMYCQLLERAVGDLKNESRASSLDTTVDLAIAAALPGSRSWPMISRSFCASLSKRPFLARARAEADEPRLRDSPLCEAGLRNSRSACSSPKYE